MDDNIIISDIKFSEEIYKRTIEENVFEEDLYHGIGEDINGNS